MKIVIASDSYKGCLTSAQVAEAAETAILSVHPDAEVIKVSVADGGEGTVEALVNALSGHLVNAIVSDPLGRPHCAEYGIAGDLAIIEVAAACGLTLLKPEERDPLVTSTRGVGELILDALNSGCRRFLVGLGGSATNDGGKGMTDILTEAGVLKTSLFSSGVDGVQFTVACDVNTPFIGPDGTSRIFSPQKGATPETVEILERRMNEYAVTILKKTGIDVRHMPGAGAAGGLGGAFHAFFGATLCPGVDMVLDVVDFDTIIKGSDLIITGEGRSDYQTTMGKTPAGVLKRAKKQGIPAALISGSIIDCPELNEMGFASKIAVSPLDIPLEDAMKADVAKQNIIRAICRLNMLKI